MAENKELERIVLTEIYKWEESEDPVLKDHTEGDADLGIAAVRLHIKTIADELNYIKMEDKKFTGYGYDFIKGDITDPRIKEKYLRELRNAREKADKKGCPERVKSGISNDRYGWYIVKK